MALNLPNIDASAVIERMKDSIGVKNDKELADVLGVSNKTVSSWKARGCVPMENVVSIGFASGKTTEYILFGANSKISVEEFIDDLNVLDFDVINIISESIFRGIMSSYAEETLLYMTEEAILAESQGIAASIQLTYPQMVRRKRSLIDEFGFPPEKFIEYERKNHTLSPEAFKVRERLRNQKKG